MRGRVFTHLGKYNSRKYNSFDDRSQRNKSRDSFRKEVEFFVKILAQEARIFVWDRCESFWLEEGKRSWKKVSQTGLS